jgi:Family of unknown function (DUF5398)
MLRKEKPRIPLFEFDLEKELKQNPSKIKEVLTTVESHIQDIKNILRKGTPSEEFDQYGILLHGYSALQRVLARIASKSKT